VAVSFCRVIPSKAPRTRGISGCHPERRAKRGVEGPLDGYRSDVRLAARRTAFSMGFVPVNLARQVVPSESRMRAIPFRFRQRPGP
jgi:hypothetical protein